uniref:Uncharacterized protein n=1 Tax=candidate division WOR-3 bacterium TaxID=2052148 RepID=A0A7V1EHS3_UNCW3
MINVADPYNPFLLSTSPDTGQDINDAYDLTVSGNFAYATFGSHLVRSDSITKKQEYPRDDTITNLVVFDISDPTNPFPVWEGAEMSFGHPVAIPSRVDTIYECVQWGSIIFVDTTWTVVNEERKDKISLTLQVHPNPFRERIEIKYSLQSKFASQNKANDTEHGIKVSSLKIYDVSGRLVKRFHHLST